MYWVVDCLSVGGAREPEVEINEWSGKIKSGAFFCQKKIGRILLQTGDRW